MHTRSAFHFLISLSYALCTAPEAWNGILRNHANYVFHYLSLFPWWLSTFQLQFAPYSVCFLFCPHPSVQCSQLWAHGSYDQYCHHHGQTDTSLAKQYAPQTYYFSQWAIIRKDEGKTGMIVFQAISLQSLSWREPVLRRPCAIPPRWRVSAPRWQLPGAATIGMAIPGLWLVRPEHPASSLVSEAAINSPAPQAHQK